MIIFGNQVIKELILKWPLFIKKIFLKKNHFLLDLVKKANLNYQICDKTFFFKKFPHSNHQFIATDLKEYQYYPFLNLLKNLEEKTNKFHLLLILDHLEDPHNFGAIIRTAKAVGVDAIIIANFNQVVVNSTVVKSSVGTIFATKIVQVANLATALEKLKQYNFWFYASEIAANAKNYTDFNYQKTNIGLILGNENKGIGKLLQKKTDFLLQIPMVDINSLNVSNAAAVILYEIRRQQKFWSLH